MPPRRPGETLTNGPMRVLRAIGFVAVPILLLALLVAALAALLNAPT